MNQNSTLPLPTAQCRWAEEDPPLGGQLSSDFWRSAEWQSILRQWDGQPIPSRWETAFASRWTGQFLYFAFRSHYDVLTCTDRPSTASKTPTLWEKEDVVEIFLAPDQNHLTQYKEFEVSPSSQWIDIDLDWSSGSKDFEWESGMESRTLIDRIGKRWEAEFRVPLRSFLPTSLSAGSAVRLNAYRVELKSQLYLAWSPTFTAEPNFHVPSKFGRMILVS